MFVMEAGWVSFRSPTKETRVKLAKGSKEQDDHLRTYVVAAGGGIVLPVDKDVADLLSLNTERQVNVQVGVSQDRPEVLCSSQQDPVTVILSCIT